MGTLPHQPTPRSASTGTGRSDRSVTGPRRSAPGPVSRLDRVTLQLGVAVAVVIACCSYAVSATSLYALGRQAGYSWWQAAAVPVVADGPAIYGMFRIISRSRRGARGAGYGWLLVTCGTAASIAGNVAHAHPNLVAQGIAAAIPLAVLAMLEGLKGDAGEVTRLAALATDLDRTGALPSPVSAPRPPPSVAPAPPPTRTPRRPSAPSGARCPPDPDRPTTARWGRGCRPPMPNHGRRASPGRPAPWPRPPVAAAAAPPASCNASAHHYRSTDSEPAQPAVAGCCAWLCLPRHPGPAPAQPPPPPRRPPAGNRRPPARGGDRLFVSGSGLRPTRQAPPRQPRAPRRQGRHHQPGPRAGLVDPPPPGQHRPRHRVPLRRPGRRRPRRRGRHPDPGRHP
jgi:hypothetical protein